MSVRNHLFQIASSSAAASVLQLGTGVMLARMLGPSGRGVYGELVFWATMVNGLTAFAIFDASSVRLRENIGHWQSQVGAMATLGIVVTAINALVLVCLAALQFAGLIEVKASYLVAYILYGATVNLAFMLGALERAQLNFATLAHERILTPLTYAILLLGAWLMHLGVTAAFVLLIASNIPVLVLRLYRNARYLTLRTDGVELRRLVKLALRFCSVLYLTLVVAQIDKAIVLQNFDEAEAGHYFVGFSIAGAAYSLISAALQTVMLPSLSGLPPRQRARRFERAARASVALSLALGLVVVIVAKPAIAIAFGPSFSESYFVAIWVALALLPMPVAALLESANLALGRNRPAMEMHATTIIIIAACWAAFGLSSVPQLCLAMFAARCVGILVAARHLIRYPLRINPMRCFLPELADVREVVGLGTHMLARFKR